MISSLSFTISFEHNNVKPLKEKILPGLSPSPDNQLSFPWPLPNHYWKVQLNKGFVVVVGGWVN